MLNDFWKQMYRNKRNAPEWFSQENSGEKKTQLPEGKKICK